MTARAATDKLSRGVTWLQLLISVLALAAAVAVPAVAGIMAFSSRVTRLETRVGDANLPALVKDVQETRDDVRWIRQEWQRERPNPRRFGK